MTGVVLKTRRLIVRQWTPEDWLEFKVLATDPRVLHYIGSGEAWSDERVQQFVNGGIKAAETRGWLLWPLEHIADKKFVGFCGFNDAFLPEVEIGWWLRPEYWGQGIASEAAGAILEHGFKTYHFPRVISVAQPANTASIRVMEKLGMHFDRGFSFRGHDVVAYALANPSSPPSDH
ncbi:MAG: GNAT family N-acetyltransferase [Candidatus Sumerlaeaceae bacterium]